ncbi:MAG: tetratricopeptide repeat protein [Pyrinomonadaceae bacterium]
MASTHDQLKFINLRAPLLRVLLIVPAFVALAGAWYAMRWYVGNTIAPYAIEVGDGGLEIARSAANLAPDDPQTHWSIAKIENKSFAPEDLAEAVRQYEKAASLSPNDYRLWLDLGRAREQAGDVAGGEQSLRHAVELAPTYALPRWYLGNMLVRQGRIDEGVDELRFAASRDRNVRNSVFDLAWRVYNGDVRTINAKLGDSPEARAQLTTYLLGRGRLDDALRLWDSLSPAEKRTERATGEGLMSALVGGGRYRAALELYATLAPQGAQLPQAGQIQNGSFETDNNITVGGRDSILNAFNWKIQPVPQAQIAFDTRVRHGGERSLRIVFNSRGNLSFTNPSQLVVVEPGARYRLQYSVRTKDLKGAGTPVIQVLNGVDGNQLGSSQPLPIGTNDWRQETIDFIAGAKTEAIILRTNRASCTTGDEVCPIFGTVWYDDFNLQRLGAGSGGSDANKPAQR